ncbi:MAG TPA: trypsin-like peptidase domain-containing protein [Anaerolineales bacterium]
MKDDLSEPSVRQNQSRLKIFQAVWQRVKKGALFFMGVLASLLALVLFNALSPKLDQLTPNEVRAIADQAMASATPAPAISAQVYQIILPSLAIIQTENVNQAGEEGYAVGSGVIINYDGVVLTALHVVEDARRIEVIFSDGTRTQASIAVAEPENDIAVLLPELPPTAFLPATISSLGGAHIGDEVFAVGNPLGLTGSLSAGVISGFNRSFTPEDGDLSLEGLIQFDAAVNPGNSGGPLLNRYGQVIGIVTGLVNPTDEDFFIGIGFAVPIEVAARAAGGPAQ